MATATMTTETPITRADRVRASYFGLKLPAGPVEAPAPAPVEVEAEPVKGDSWMGETVALLLTNAAVEGVEAGCTEAEADRLFEALEAESQVDFRAFLDSIGRPAATWGEWLALCVAGSPVAFESPEPEPTGGFAPSPELDAERLGRELGSRGIDAAPTANLSRSCRDAFLAGLEAGRLDLQGETLERDDRLARERDEAMAGPVARWHEAELCQARSGPGHSSYLEP